MSRSPEFESTEGLWSAPATRREHRPRMPAYRQLCESLRELVLSGPTNARLPTDEQLRRQYGVSRHTVRRAYQELVADGVVVRKRRLGTFANARGPYVRAVGSIEDVIAQSVDSTIEVVVPLAVDPSPPPEVLIKLRTDSVMKTEVSRVHEGTPLSVGLVWLPTDVGMLLANAPFLHRSGQRRPTTIVELIDAVLPTRINRAQQTISVARIPAAIAPRLDLKAGDPALLIERLFLGADDRPVEFTYAYFHPSRYSYRLELARSSTWT